MTHRRPLRLVVLISGPGTNLQALIHAQHAGELDAEIQAVFSDHIDAQGLERARRADIDARYINPADYDDGAAFDAALAQEILVYDPDLVVLAGFMRILSPSFVETFAGRMLNIHPSLLPRFKGLDTHRRVLQAGERFHGATVHFVTKDMDGGPSVIQYRIQVRTKDTATSLKDRVSQGEHIVLPRAVAWFAEQRLSVNDGAVMLDGRQLMQPVLVEGEV
ncbi:MAG: phosphoribosylglycinamide formyltransferase [Gammaproteobacteria bacterium]|nr:MAG: phosphoribosylglycinamide formyltransferase [Gammaproteobacteria bacterium]TDJ43529.1 MAG: phosphoribosylglycinamide formyltransferase [Gammaproteobacteria bacterium]